MCLFSFKVDDRRNRKKQKMKLGLDLHGVLDKNPEVWEAICGALVTSNECEVHIITGGTLKHTRRFLDVHGIMYTHIYSITDDFLSKKIKMLKDRDGNMTFPNKLWNKAKAEYCRKNKINLMIDDTLNYGKHFVTPFAYFRSEK